MQLALHVVQNCHAGEQKSHCDKIRQTKDIHRSQYIILNGNFLCLSCPRTTFALQHGGFVPRKWLAAKGLSVQVLPVLLPSSPGKRRGACVTQAGDQFESHAWNTTIYNRLTGPYKPTLCLSKTLFNSTRCSFRKTLSWNKKHNLFYKQAFLMQWCHTTRLRMIQMSILLFTRVFYMNTTSGHSKGANLNNLLQKHLLILKQTLGHKRYNADPRKAPHLVEELCMLFRSSK